MAEVLEVVGEKGGIGKTTTAFTLATMLSVRLHYKVLALGFDPQAHLEKVMGYEKDLLNQRPSIFQTLGPERTCSITDIIVKTELDKESLIYLSQDPRKVAARTLPASQIMRGPDLAFINDSAMTDTLSKHNGWALFLREALQPILHLYDYIVIDTNPTGGFLLGMALAAGDFAITPLKPEELDVAGLKGILTMIRRTMAPAINPKLRIAGVFFNQIMAQWALHQDYMAQVRASLQRDAANCPIFDTNIKLLSPIASGISGHCPVILREPFSPAAKMWWHLFQEMAMQIGGQMPVRLYQYIKALDQSANQTSSKPSEGEGDGTGKKKQADPFLLPKFYEYMLTHAGQAATVNKAKGA